MKDWLFVLLSTTKVSRALPDTGTGKYVSSIISSGNDKSTRDQPPLNTTAITVARSLIMQHVPSSLHR